MSERCIYAMLLLREKRVVLPPMLERTAVCGTIAGEQCLRRRENSCKRMQRQIYLHYAECSRIWIKSTLAPQRSADRPTKRREFPYVYKGMPLGKVSLITVPLTEEGRAVYGGGSSPIFTNEHQRSGESSKQQ